MFSKDRSVFSKDRSMFSKDRSMFSKDRSMFSKGRWIANSSRDRSMFSKDRSVFSKDRSMFSKDRSMFSKDRLMFSKGRWIANSSRDQSMIDRCLVKVAGLINITKSRSFDTNGTPHSSLSPPPPQSLPRLCVGELGELHFTKLQAQAGNDPPRKFRVGVAGEHLYVRHGGNQEDHELKVKVH